MVQLNWLRTIGRVPVYRQLTTKVCSSDIPEVQEHFPELKKYKELYDFSIKYPDQFWEPIAKSRLRWIEDFKQVLDYRPLDGYVRWFEGGKLNVSVQCLDRHVESDPDSIAILWEKDEPGQHEQVSYKQLSHLTCQIANWMKSNGVRRGDRVAIYLPVSPIAVASMLACARIGAVHSVVFAGFSAEALASRINDAAAKIVITADHGVRGGRITELKKTVDLALEKCPTVEKVLVARRTGKDVPMKYPRDICLDEALKEQSTECLPEAMKSEDALFMLYTSGSTGKPKGIVHTQAGYILYASFTHKHVFNCHKGDVFGCVADIGWITGHTYVVYGPLANGVTTVLFESSPIYPDPGRYWETVDRLKINQFYGAPTALRLLLKHGDKWVHKYDRSSLKTLGSVGEPINNEAWEWFHQVIGDGNCDVVDTWWQTETGGICMSPRPSSPNASIKPAMCMRPMLGIEPVLVNTNGEICHGENQSGALCLKTPWPGMARTIYGDHQRFIETYFSVFPGIYFTGDGAGRDDEGHYHISGRMDDIINVTGHRLGTAEVEDALGEHSSVAESAVVGFPHPLKGEAVYAFVVLRDEIEYTEEAVVKDLKQLIKGKIAGYAVPELIQICSNLPKTRSGKIMRRILRKIAANQLDDIGDVSTLSDPSVVESILKDRPNVGKNLSS